MTNAQAVAVILRVVGIWLVINSLIVGLFAIPSLLSSPTPMTAITISILFLFLLLGTWLALRPLVVAQTLLPSAPHDETTANWSVDEFQAAMFSALGMYFLVITVTDLNGLIEVWDHVQASTRKGAVTGVYEYSRIGSLVLRLVAGVWLLLGAKGLRRILQKLRS